MANPRVGLDGDCQLPAEYLLRDVEWIRGRDSILRFVVECHSGTRFTIKSEVDNAIEDIASATEILAVSIDLKHKTVVVGALIR